MLLQQRLQGLSFRHSAAKDEELREDEDEEDESEAAAPPPPSPLFTRGPRAMMAAALPPARSGAPAGGGEQAPPLRGKSVNTTECVPVPSSEHVAEIVGRQGCKIKALRAKTNTYIKTPVRGEAPVFVVTGRRQDVAAAKREIQSAAEHFSLLRASRGKSAVPGAPCWGAAPPGQTTAPVRVPYRVVGLVVGPKGATIKRIQQQTHTYIVTPGRDSEPVFEVTGTPENVDRARQEIELHIALRTGAFLADGAFEFCPAWPRAGYRDGSCGSPGSGSTDSPFGRPADFSPASPFGAGGFWPGAEEPPPDCGALPAAWAPPEPAAAPPAGPPTPRLSPTTPEGPEPPAAYTAAFSTGTDSYASSNGGSSASSSPPECRRRRDCLLCLEGEAAAAAAPPLPCGRGLLCPRCAARVRGTACPVCRAGGAQPLQIRS